MTYREKVLTNGHLHDLPDVQNAASTQGIALWKAGIKDVEMPVHFVEPTGGAQLVRVSASMTVGLDHRRKGVNMSRFITQLAQWSREHSLSIDLRPFLEECRRRLESDSAHAELRFRYFVDKKAPVTGIGAPVGYDILLGGSLENRSGHEGYEVTLGVSLFASNCCPCSKAISDYGAHNQRVKIEAELRLDTEADLGTFSLEKLISELEETASCPAYPLLKRPDEKYVTERQYENPKFVEDVAREGVELLRGYDRVRGYTFEVEALESIHGHNAWAIHREDLY